MDLPDCPPGTEGYQDSVVELPKKSEKSDGSCTKAELEFQDHLNSLKIRLDNGETRCMVERRGRDISGKWIYLCYPCGSVCSGESILQTHISGKKHKVKLSMRTTWPMSIFDDHPFNQNQKTGPAVSTATDQVLQKMAAAVEVYTKPPSEMEQKYNKYREATCHIQEDLDKLKGPLVGVEYLVEHPPEMPHYEPSYLCTLCTKQGHPRTIVNHLTCFWHRYNYLLRHFPKATHRLAPYKGNNKYREGVNIIMNRLTQRIADKFGRLKPVNIDKEEFEKDKEQILQWLFKGPHFSEKSGITLEEVVDPALIESLAKYNEARDDKSVQKTAPIVKKRDPSPPTVAAPSKPNYNSRRRERRLSMESLSDISDDDLKRPKFNKGRPVTAAERAYNRDRLEPKPDRQHEKYADQRREIEVFRSKYVREIRSKEEKPIPKFREPYKVNLAEEKRAAAEEAAKQMLIYHEKNPEKHPLYPEEWKKFWNRRYKEIQAEGKDPAKHDYKPEWIVFWTKRMKELHQEELETQISEIYRRMNLPPPDKNEPKVEKRPERRKSPERPDRDRRRSPERRRSPVWNTRRSPDPRRRSPDPRRRSPPRREYRVPEKRVFPDPRYSLDRRVHPTHNPAPERASPPPKRSRSRSPVPRHRSASHTNIILESVRRSRSPLSRRESELRNRSPLSRREAESRNRSPHACDLAPSLQTVMISDDELKTCDDELSPWNSDNDMESMSSISRSARAPSHAPSHASSRARFPAHRHHELQDLGPPENIVATLRVLVALEDYLGSLGPKIVDLLTEALKMEKDRANSSEELLERETAVVLIETAKEKLKGAAQAGLVQPAAAPALRAAIVRTAATLHEADTRTRKKQQTKTLKPSVTNKEAVPVAGVGEVDREQIAKQMAAALIAQGKTDVTSEELAQLVDAVVGMAEAKKREAEATKKVEVKVVPPPARVQSTLAAKSGTATALQLLQSAYDENDKKLEKEETPDAMDGLSDSDLETLLKNFNELSAEEQHSLIAYLKKLEAREPQRVERLRQYVSAAATTTAPAVDEAEVKKSPIPEKPKETKTVTIESDDDDYTVEEVFKSATQKVKEDQIRKELDIVTKSLVESTTKKEDESEPLAPVKVIPLAQLSNKMSAASDLFALVQASIKSTSAAPAASAQTIDVVASGTQPRSFGDLPEKSIESLVKPKISPNIPVATAITVGSMQESVLQPQNPSNSDMNYNNDENDSYSEAVQWEPNQMDDNDPSSMGDQGYDEYNQDQGMRDPGPNQFRSGPNSGPNQFGTGPNSGPNQFGSGPNSGPNQFGSGPNSGPNQFGSGPNSGPNLVGSGPNSGPNQFGSGPNSGPNQFGSGPNSGPNQFGSGPSSGPNQFGSGPNSGPNQFGSGPNSGPNQFGSDPNSGPNQFGSGPDSGPNQFGSGPNSGPNQFGSDPNSGSNQFGQGPGRQFGPKSGFGSPSSGFGQGLNSQPNQYGQGSGSFQYGKGPNQFGPGQNQFNQGPNPDWQENQGQNPNWAPNNYQQNQGMRDNFMNGGRGDNLDNRPQQFGNINQPFGINIQFRGRGGGGRGRGRNRGRF